MVENKVMVIIKKREKVERWIHLTYMRGDQWVLPVWSAINKAAESGKCGKVTDDLGELGLWISTRLDIFPQIAKRVNKETAKLLEAAKKHDDKHIFSADKEGYAFPDPSNPNQKEINKNKKALIIDINSLIFELKATCELINTLFERLYFHANKELPKSDAGKSVKYVLKKEGGNVSWFADLNSLRNLFIHNATPYLAIDITKADNYDIVIMKNNLKDFSDDEKFLKLSELSNIVQGFLQTKGVLQKHLISLFSEI